MYDKEVLFAIIENHLYEYVVVNRHFKIIKYSEHFAKYCHMGVLFEASDEEKTDLFEVVPECIGMEDVFVDILAGDVPEIVIPVVFRAPEDYVNIYIRKAEQGKTNTPAQTLIILFENITQTANAQQLALQSGNDNVLLLAEIASKNEQLEMFNKEMQRLVEEEVQKNLEKQRTIELQARHAAMGEMIGMITHQWKQPLSVIQTICSLLKIKYEFGTLDKNMFDEKITNVLKQTAHMNQTVQDFQRFFTPSKEKKYFNIMETVGSVLALVGMEYALKSIKISLEGDKVASAYGYPNEYNQVILSLLQNAKDAFLKQPHKEMQISIAVQKQSEHSLVCIKDNAGGIPENIIGQIFTQYMSTKVEGSGLGLYIAKSAIENNMGGKLWADNIENGAKFSIWL